MPGFMPCGQGVTDSDYLSHNCENNNELGILCGRNKGVTPA